MRARIASWATTAMPRIGPASLFAWVAGRLGAFVGLGAGRGVTVTRRGPAAMAPGRFGVATTEPGDRVITAIGSGGVGVGATNAIAVGAAVGARAVAGSGKGVTSLPGPTG